MVGATSTPPSRPQAQSDYNEASTVRRDPPWSGRSLLAGCAMRAADCSLGASASHFDHIPRGQWRRIVILQTQSGLVLSRRLIRFGVVGASAGALQLALLVLLSRSGVPAVSSDALAFLLAAQLNFVLSRRFTWGDRPRARLPQQWAAFHASIAGTGALNIGVFSLARLAAANPFASLIGIAAASSANFLIGDRAIFRPRTASNATSSTETTPSPSPPEVPPMRGVRPEVGRLP
jgi:putative flippase GtrA